MPWVGGWVLRFVGGFQRATDALNNLVCLGSCTTLTTVQHHGDIGNYGPLVTVWPIILVDSSEPTNFPHRSYLIRGPYRFLYKSISDTLQLRSNRHSPGNPKPCP